MSQRNLKAYTLPRTPRHISRPSEDTNASGIADSAISYSAFPEPPSSIPPTPIRSVFEPADANLSIGPSPGSSRNDSHLIRSPIALTSNQLSRSTLDRSSSRVLTSQQGKQGNDTNSLSGSNISPYDWHEGASSIDVDATEDRLLPTSFITSLLRENTGPRAANRASYSSDAISGISEMTYPPRNPFMDSLRGSSAIPSHEPSPRQSHRGPSFRPIGGRPRDSYQREKVHESRCYGAHSSGKSGLATQQNLGPTEHKAARKELMISQSTCVTEQLDEGKSGEKLATYGQVEETEDDSQAGTQTSSPSGSATYGGGLIRQYPLVDIDSRNRESVHSTRSTAPSFLSRISSVGRRVIIWRRKPLPPLPVIPPATIPTGRENRTMDEQEPITELVVRANHLHGLLEKGYHPHQSVISYPEKSEQFTSSFDDATTIERLHRNNTSRQPHSSGKFRPIVWIRNNKPWAMLGIFIIIAIVVIGVAVGVTAQRNKIQKTSSCPENVGGLNCNLNATCVCTSSSSPSCGSPIGQAVLDVIPVMNKVLSTNIATSAVYTSLWIAQGGVQGSDCVEQVNMIDVGPGLDPAVQPNRTQWAQSALLWTLTQTQDSQSVAQLRKFVQKAAWSHLATIDGPTSVDPGFTVAVAGFNYDFALQKISPVSAKFVVDGQPSDEQISRVDALLMTPLDRMYSYAVAMSEQRDNALLQYWTNMLHQPEDRLEPFKAAFNSSPIILPFDATSQPIQNLYNVNSFPPPTACYPGLRPDQHDLVNAVEGEAFGLAQVNSASQFNASCFPMRPVYGILNALRLRLPFSDSVANVTRQGVVLKLDAAPRAILANGTSLSALPGPINTTRSLSAAADPRNYGTVTHANHIILEYLSTMPINIANTVIGHILNTTSSSTPLLPDLVNDLPFDSIPSLEVAIFGNIEASDIGLYVSSFTTPTGSLFFGSSDGSTLRTWAIGRGGQVAWTENATSPEVVYDNSFSDHIFNLTWAATSTGIDTNAPNVGLANITTTFDRYQRFSP